MAWKIGDGCGAVLTFILHVFCRGNGSGGGWKFNYPAQYCARLRVWGWVRVSVGVGPGSGLVGTSMDRLS